MVVPNTDRLKKAAKVNRVLRARPDLYARHILGVEWWSQQIEIAMALVRYRRVMVLASHSIGKTHLAGGLVNWFYDSFDPSICLSTAPTAKQLTDALWKEVRVQRAGRPGLQPKAPRIESAPDHFAAGYTAKDGAAFQGRHEEHIFALFDEAQGVDGEYWDATDGMLTSDQSYWLAILNPTDTGCRAYDEYIRGTFHTISVNAMTHPNIAAQLRGEAAPYPKAVTLGWLEARIREWCDPIHPGDAVESRDFEFPPASGRWYRPGPLFEGRVLGRFPTEGTNNVWSGVLFDAACEAKPWDRTREIQIGCDVARFGDDLTEIIVRIGTRAVHWEAHNGWNTTKTAMRLKELCEWYGPRFNKKPREIICHIDDDGVGGGVVDKACDDEGNNMYRFMPSNSAINAIEPHRYKPRRSELWFTTVELAKDGLVDLSMLPKQAQLNLRRQCLAPTYRFDGAGRRIVEPKDDTKVTIKRSPDTADALNLAFTNPITDLGENKKAHASFWGTSMAPDDDDFDPTGMVV